MLRREGEGLNKIQTRPQGGKLENFRQIPLLGVSANGMFGKIKRKNKVKVIHGSYGDFRYLPPQPISRAHK